MCTVTFIPVRDNFFISSSRDEKLNRVKATSPTVHTYHGRHMLFPKDGQAGGTWIAAKENGDAAVLLNGAFLPHVSHPPYKKSRGIILLDILSKDFPSLEIVKSDLKSIEPFTLILFEKNCLYEFRWDGQEKFCKQIPVNRPHIWSSSTLYDGLVMKKREKWFASFLNKKPSPTQFDIINFHTTGGDGDERNNIRMNREGAYATVSICSLQLNHDRAFMKYLDLQNDRSSEIKIELEKMLQSA